MGHKFVMVGGGSTQSPGILEVLRQRSEELRLTDLVLYDIDEERVSLLGQYTKMYYAETGSTVNVSYTTDIDEAFTGADYLFMQIRPGLNRQRAIDEKNLYSKRSCRPRDLWFGRIFIRYACDSSCDGYYS